MAKRLHGPNSRGKAAGLFGFFCIAFVLAIATSRSLPVSSLPDPGDAHVALSDVEQAVAAIYPVPEIAGAEAERLLDRHEAVLFDVRESREFDASHLPGAIRVDPNVTAEGFVAENGASLKGRIAVFYCAVGVRSALMVERVASAIVPFRPVAALNLRGGIFRWFAEGRAISNANGPATRIDPYNDAWGRLLERTLGARS